MPLDKYGKSSRVDKCTLCCSYNASTLYFKSIKEVFNVQRAWYSLSKSCFQYCNPITPNREDIPYSPLVNALGIHVVALSKLRLSYEKKKVKGRLSSTSLHMSTLTNTPGPIHIFVIFVWNSNTTYSTGGY